MPAIVGESRPDKSDSLRIMCVFHMSFLREQFDELKMILSRAPLSPELIGSIDMAD